MFRKFTNMKSFSQLITKNREIQKYATEFMYIKTEPQNQKSEYFLSRSLLKKTLYIASHGKEITQTTCKFSSPKQNMPKKWTKKNIFASINSTNSKHLTTIRGKKTNKKQ